MMDLVVRVSVRLLMLTGVLYKQMVGIDAQAIAASLTHDITPLQRTNKGKIADSVGALMLDSILQTEHHPAIAAVGYLACPDPAVRLGVMLAVARDLFL